MKNKLNKWVVHCKKKPFDVYIGRPSKFGNPYTNIKDKKTLAKFVVKSKEEAVRKFKEDLKSNPKFRATVKKELKGKILGCWCDKPPCHGYVLAEIANGQLFR